MIASFFLEININENLIDYMSHMSTVWFLFELQMFDCQMLIFIWHYWWTLTKLFAQNFKSQPWLNPPEWFDSISFIARAHLLFKLGSQIKRAASRSTFIKQNQFGLWRYIIVSQLVKPSCLLNVNWILTLQANDKASETQNQILSKFIHRVDLSD